MNITKETPKKYLIYLANNCKKEIKDFSSRIIKCREEGHYNNQMINKYQDILEKINLAGLKTDLIGNLK